MKSSVLVLQMDKFRQISTELWPLIDVINWFSLSIFGISLPIFFKLCMKRSSFKMIFFALKNGVCCMSAALLFLFKFLGKPPESSTIWIQIVFIRRITTII